MVGIKMSASIMTGYHMNMEGKPSSKKSCRFCFLSLL